jgi:hypothetical protein
LFYEARKEFKKATPELIRNKVEALKANPAIADGKPGADEARFQILLEAKAALKEATDRQAKAAESAANAWYYENQRNPFDGKEKRLPQLRDAALTVGNTPEAEVDTPAFKKALTLLQSSPEWTVIRKRYGLIQDVGEDLKGGK